MQQSVALRKYDDEENQLDPLSREPQFGQRPTRSRNTVNTSAPELQAPVAPQPSFISEVSAQRIVRVKTDEAPIALGYVPGLESVPLYNPADFQKQALVPSIIKDVFTNIATFILIFVATTLAVYKVHQVQSTREMTVKYNDINKQNELMHKEWLSLLSEREALTEYSVIKSLATENLAMVQPKTEAEVVIDLR